MFNYEPNGRFIAETNHDSVGHVFSINYGKLGWIGLLIVKAGYRGKSIGTLLMKKAIEYLLNQGVETIKLEGVPEVPSLYRKLGFVNEYDSLRFVRDRKETAPDLKLKCVSPLKAVTSDRVATFDEKYFGANRMRVVNRLFQEYPDHCFVAHSDIGIRGYIMCRKAETGYKLGPWICDQKHTETVEELLATCLSSLKQDNVYVGVPSVNKAAIKTLNEFGFEQCLERSMPVKSIRMRLGKELSNECLTGVFAIGGPMKG
jgi:ribosomal protein S18 acetylase RimI-like enzyme